MLAGMAGKIWEGVMIRGIHHTAISTGDLERALGFYRDLLGFKEVVRFGWDADAERESRIVGLPRSAARGVMLDAGNSFLELWEYSNPEPKSGDPERPVCDHGWTHICIDVTDIDAEYERLKAAGMRFNCPPQYEGDFRTTYGRDPDGNVVEIQEIKNRDMSTYLKIA